MLKILRKGVKLSKSNNYWAWEYYYKTRKLWGDLPPRDYKREREELIEEQRAFAKEMAELYVFKKKGKISSRKI